MIYFGTQQILVQEKDRENLSIIGCKFIIIPTTFCPSWEDTIYMAVKLFSSRYRVEGIEAYRVYVANVPQRYMPDILTFLTAKRGVYCGAETIPF